MGSRRDGAIGPEPPYENATPDQVLHPSSPGIKHARRRSPPGRQSPPGCRLLCVEEPGCENEMKHVPRALLQMYVVPWVQVAMVQAPRLPVNAAAASLGPGLYALKTFGIQFCTFEVLGLD